MGEETAQMAASLVEVHKNHVLWGQRDTMEVGKWTISRPTSYWNRAISIAILDFLLSTTLPPHVGAFPGTRAATTSSSRPFWEGFPRSCQRGFPKSGMFGTCKVGKVQVSEQ